MPKPGNASGKPLVNLAGSSYITIVDNEGSRFTNASAPTKVQDVNNSLTFTPTILAPTPTPRKIKLKLVLNGPIPTTVDTNGNIVLAPPDSGDLSITLACGVQFDSMPVDYVVDQ